MVSPVKSQCSVRRACSLLLVCWFSILSASGSNLKPLGLRNQDLAIKAAATAKTKALASAPASGLFVIQFREPVKPEWRAQLRALGVDLLRYVPQDAFVAQFENVNPKTIQKLPYVQYVGEYRKENKVHRQLQSGASLTAAKLNITVLLSPRANDQDAAQAKLGFGKVQQETKLRSGRVLRGEVTPAQLNSLAQSAKVLWIEAAPTMKLNDEVSSKIVAGDGGPNTLDTQLLGYDGSGVKVSVTDSGLNNGDAETMHPDLFGRTPAFFYYGDLEDAADEHSHGTHCAGIIAGNGATGETDDNGALWGLGVAPGASIIAQRMFDGAGGYHPPSSFEKLTRDAKSAGADIGSNSWGDDTQGRYDVSAMEFDELVRDADLLTPGDQPYILEFSAGNAGPGTQTIGSPAVGKNVIATGASQNDRPDLFIYSDGPEAMADFSSRGPCEDGRIKPDVCAPGTWIASLQSESATDENAWSPIDYYYQYQGGTSQAGPHCSGAAAVFVDFYRQTHAGLTPSPALVKAALINSAWDLDDDVETDAAPNNDEGWGRVDLVELLDSDRTYDFVDQTTLLTNGQVFERRVLIGDAGEPFRATLTYTDVPGFPAAIPSLVNNLDLEVEGPNGRIYRGNQFLDGESVPDALSNDDINNVEGVNISEPPLGEYVIRVYARNIVEDSRNDTAAVDQDFALAISGLVPAPGTGVITLDRTRYAAPGQIKIKLTDTNLAGNPTATVQLTNVTKAVGKTITLVASGANGTFTNTVATVTGVAGANQLQIAHNDAIQLSYFDASAATTRFANAVADLVAPTLTGVSTTNAFGGTLVKWTSDEPANSIVVYGTNLTPTLAVTNNALTLDHSIALNNLIVSNTYRFYVISVDEAGNRRTNNNGGALFTFVAPSTATILFVDAYETFEDDPSPVISASEYTSALDQTGLDYEIWTVSEQGSPGTNILHAYPVVIWRVNDSLWGGFAAYQGLTPTEQTTLTRYVQDGGSLLLTSMELLSRMGNTASALAFRTNVLHLANFAEDTSVTYAEGVDNDIIADGMSLSLDYSQYDNEFWELIGQSPNVSDTITPSSDASPIFLDFDTDQPCGVRYPKTGQDSTGRVVFLSFPLDSVSNSDAPPDNRGNLLRKVISFLVPGVKGIGTLNLDRPAYSIPSLMTVELGDSDLAGQSTATVKFYSSSQTNGITVALQETPRPGLFRGSVALIPVANTPGPGEMRAKANDDLWVDYIDISTGSNGIVRATAIVDVTAPTVFGVVAQADYEDCVVTWQTSEPSDSLVQFGESSGFLNRSGYDPTLTMEHEIVVHNLTPDRLYYFQVASRDIAGNIITDDHYGTNYTFRTLVPLNPPFIDNFITNSQGWGTFTADGSETEWQFGTPFNLLQTSAHSPTNAWGTALNLAAASYSETYLISPAINLVGGNKAELRFWHCYDFTEQSEFDILEGGQIFIITNALSDLTPIAEYIDAEPDWYEERIDLTPYIGHVVYVVWYYQLFSIESAIRSGWLVDDVSITVSNAAAGNLIITNNLWQSTFALSGPAVRTGGGVSTLLTNLPIGEYVVEFGSVPYYQTPAKQTNNVTANVTNTIAVTYAFPDANNNGISDLWETQNFGVVDAGRLATTDTDKDGMTDKAEFLAGTDPNNPPASFKLMARLTNNLVRLEWSTVSNQTYAISSRTNKGAWTAFGAPIQAISVLTTYSFAANTNGTQRMFRVEWLGSSSPLAPAPTLRVNASLLGNSTVRLTWPSTIGRGYRIHGSINGTNWSAYTGWLQATANSSQFTLPTPTNNAPRMFRVEVKP